MKAKIERDDRKREKRLSSRGYDVSFTKTKMWQTTYQKQSSGSWWQLDCRAGLDKKGKIVLGEVSLSSSYPPEKPDYVLFND